MRCGRFSRRQPGGCGLPRLAYMGEQERLYSPFVWANSMKSPSTTKRSPTSDQVGGVLPAISPRRMVRPSLSEARATRPSRTSSTVLPPSQAYAATTAPSLARSGSAVAGAGWASAPGVSGRSAWQADSSKAAKTSGSGRIMASLRGGRRPSIDRERSRWCGDLRQHGQVVARASGDAEQVPDRVRIGQRFAVVEHGAERVEEPARDRQSVV